MISVSAVTTRHELIMSLVAGLNLIMQGVEASGHEPVRKLWTTEGELASSRESKACDRGNASWSLISKVWSRTFMTPYATE